MLYEPLPEGPAKGKVVELDKMLPAYYQYRGWDAKGWPTPQKLQELGLA
jgi:aldehyde:ferredoxin oxidoreductase